MHDKLMKQANSREFSFFIKYSYTVNVLDLILTFNAEYGAQHIPVFSYAVLKEWYYTL